MIRRKRSQAPYQYQQLEARKLLAGNVFARLVGSNLIVVGNHESNSFSINLNANTAAALVQGQDGTGVTYDSSLTNGFNSTQISNVSVFANGGDDSVTIDARSGVARENIVVSLGAGSDSLYMTGGVLEGNMTVYGGFNDDSVFIHDTQFDGNLAIIMGGGSDVAALDSVVATGQTRFLGQFGQDSLLVRNSTFFDSLYAEMGDGNDRFETTGSNYQNRLSIRGRKNFDTAMVYDGSNSFAYGVNLQTVEQQFQTPNADGAVDDPIGLLKESFLATGAEQRFYTANEIQNSMRDFANDWGVSLIDLSLDEETQFVTINDATPTVSLVWDQVIQDAVVASSPGPTIASRAYAMMHTAMYDAWSAYDATAISTVLDDTLQRPQYENTENNKRAAMSFAAFRVLEDLFADQTADFEQIMEQLGFNPANQSLNSTAAGIGNQMAAALLAERQQDGSNQLGDDANGVIGVPYSDTSGYSPVNAVGDSSENIELWTPEFVPIDADPGTAAQIQQFLTPHWGDVESFALSSGSQFRPVAPEPFLLVDGTVNLDYGTIQLANGSTVSINESIVGTIINPEFIAQAQEVVDVSANLTDEQKLIAEFWEDGGGTAFPPGTFMTFAQYVSARDNHATDDDAQLFFAMSNAVFDAGIATWEAKVHYDYARPVRVIRELGNLGLIGEYDATLGGYAIDAWTPDGGTQRILATEFLTYQTPGGDPSPPFAEYTSGHSAFSAAGAAVLQLFTGSDDFGASVTFPAGTSRFEPGVTPVSELTLAWDTFSEAADEGGISRIYGGIHFDDGDINGRTLGAQVGQSAFDRAFEFINGTA